MADPDITEPEDKRKVLEKMQIGGLTVSEDGKINGYIKKEIRENIDFKELFEEADNIRGKATIQFEKDISTDEK